MSWSLSLLWALGTFGMLAVFLGIIAGIALLVERKPVIGISLFILLAILGSTALFHYLG